MQAKMRVTSAQPHRLGVPTRGPCCPISSGGLHCNLVAHPSSSIIFFHDPSSSIISHQKRRHPFHPSPSIITHNQYKNTDGASPLGSRAARFAPGAFHHGDDDDVDVVVDVVVGVDVDDDGDDNDGDGDGDGDGGG